MKRLKSISKWLLAAVMRRGTNTEHFWPRDKYDEITRTIIIGTICDEINDIVHPGAVSKSADRIMDLMSRRYELIQKPGNH